MSAPLGDSSFSDFLFSMYIEFPQEFKATCLQLKKRDSTRSIEKRSLEVFKGLEAKLKSKERHLTPNQFKLYSQISYKVKALSDLVQAQEKKALSYRDEADEEGFYDAKEEPDLESICEINSFSSRAYDPIQVLDQCDFLSEKPIPQQQNFFLPKHVEDRKKYLDEATPQQLYEYFQYLWPLAEWDEEKLSVIKYLEKSAEQGHSDAKFRYVDLLLQENGVIDQDIDKAFNLLESLADSGSDFAKLRLADSYYKGDIISQDLEKAAFYYKELAFKNYQYASHCFAMMLYKGEGVKKDVEKAFQFFEKGAQKEISESFFYLALINYKTENLEAAKKFAKLGVEKEDPHAMLLEFFLKSYPDLTEDKLYQDLENEDFSENTTCAYEQLKLGFMYFLGIAKPCDEAMSFKYFQLAAENGIAAAQFCCGIQLFNQGNEEQGMAYIKKAASQKLAEAQLFEAISNLAADDDEASDLNLAHDYLESASSQGLSRASFLLASLYYEKFKEEAENLEEDFALKEQDLLQAVEYFKIALGQGSHEVADYLISLIEDGSLSMEMLFMDEEGQISPENMYLCGLLYLNQQKRSQDYEKTALELLKVASQRGNSEASFCLGQLFWNGLNTIKPDYLFSIQYFLSAEAQENPRARVYLESLLSELTKKVALERGPVAQEAQNALNMYHYMVAYHNAESVEDKEQLYQQALSKHHPESTYHLGLLFLEATGVFEQDTAMAKKFFELAVTQGSQEAQAMLNFTSEDGNDPISALEKIAGKDPQVLPNIDRSFELKIWLERLELSTEFIEKTDDTELSLQSRRQAFALRVLDLLQVADSNQKFYKAFKLVVENAGRSCGDRVSLSLVKLDIEHYIATASKDKQITGYIYRAIVDKLEEYAITKIIEMNREKENEAQIQGRMFDVQENGVDQVEVFLAFSEVLKKRFAFPIWGEQDMLYFEHSGLSGEDLDVFTRYINSFLKNPQKLSGLLIKYDDVLNLLQEKYPPQFTIIQAAKKARLQEKNEEYMQDGYPNYIKINENYEADLQGLMQSLLKGLQAE